MQGEGEERAAPALALLQPLLAGWQKQRLLLQQSGFMVGAGLPAAAPSTALDWTDRWSPLAGVLPVPAPYFSWWNGGWRERELGTEGVGCVCMRGALTEGNDNEEMAVCVCRKGRGRISMSTHEYSVRVKGRTRKEKLISKAHRKWEKAFRPCLLQRIKLIASGKFSSAKKKSIKKESKIKISERA